MQEKFYLHFPGMKIISITFLNASFNMRNRCNDYHYKNVKKVQKFKSSKLLNEQLSHETQILFLNNNQVLIP